MKKTKVAVAGLGRIGKIHLDNLCRNCDGMDVIAVMDPLEESLGITAGYGISQVFTDYDNLIAVDGLEADGGRQAGS